MPNSRKRILVCIDWFEPGFKAGGPIRSVANIVNALKNDFEFYILTSAYDLNETKPYEGIEVNQWHDRNGVFVKYLDKQALSASSIRGNILEINPELLYLNSLFSKPFTLTPLLLANRKKIQVVLAPRGMLGQGALKIKKNKKRFFLLMSRLTGLYRNVTWHASTEDEEINIRKEFGRKARIKVARNIPIMQSKKLDEILNQKNTGTCRFIYLGRVVPIKNLHLAIDAIMQVKNRMPVFFDIYGNIEDQAYFDSFKHKIKDHGNVKIEYKGVLNPASIADVYMHADYMILPTAHENYGHAIVEAWANGCPVIISKNTPWKNLRIRDLGWDVDINDPQNLIHAIQEGIDIDFTSYISMVRSSYTFFAEKICDESVLKANKELFES